MYSTNIKHLLIIIGCFVIISACKPNINSSFKKSATTFSIVDEYICRVGKKLLIVSDSTNQHLAEINFYHSNKQTTFLKIDLKSNQIVVSKGLLEQLQNEAELAAILAIGIETLEHTDYLNFDNKVINLIYKAGYDPMALVELQEEYLAHKNDDNWLDTVFSSMELTRSKLNNNKNLASSLSKGKKEQVSVI